MNISSHPIRIVILLAITCMLTFACSQSEQDVMQHYLKRMTEVAIIIENIRSQEGAVSAASHITEMSSNINQLVDSIRSLPQQQQDQLMREHADSISQINQRISSALSELALLDAKARRTISDALIRLNRL